MLKSMTGYGKAEFSLKDEKGETNFTVELKSLNHRYLDINVRMPDRFMPLETRIRDYIKKKFSRGSISIYINSTGGQRASLRLNVPLAKAYLEAGEELREKLGLTGETDVPFMLTMRDMFSPEKETGDCEKDWRELKEGLKKTSDELLKMRETEGAALKEDVTEKISTVEKHLFLIEKKAPEITALYREKIKGEIKALVGKADEARILTEAAIFAERINVEEEVVRLKSHFKQMRVYLESTEPTGRKLDFLCQELLREANTIASKSQDMEITQTVVEIKGDLEKIREQVQNIE